MVLTRRSSSESNSSTPSTSRDRGRKDVKGENSAVVSVKSTIRTNRLVGVKKSDDPPPPPSSPVSTPPVRRSKRLSSDYQDVVSLQTPSPWRRPRRTWTDNATPTRRSTKGSPDHQDTPVVHTPKRRRRRTSTDAPDTPVVPPSSVRRSTRRSDVRISECELSDEALNVSGRPADDEQCSSLTKETDEQTDSESTTLTLESISEEEEEETPLTHSKTVVEDKYVCEVGELQIIKLRPETLPVIEEEQVDVDGNSESSKPISVNEEDHVPKPKVEGLAVTEEVQEVKDDVTTAAVKSEETKEKIIEESTLILTEESTEDSEDEKDEKALVLDLGFEGGSDCSASSTTAMETDDLVVADETVSTTVTTDEDCISNSGNEIKSDNVETVLEKEVEEVMSKDLEVTSTTNMGASAQHQEIESLNNRLTEQLDDEKMKPVIDNNMEVSDGNLPAVIEKASQLKNIPRGMPISGRWWKKEKQRFRSINKDSTGKKSWGKKMKMKQERQNVMAKSAALQEEKQRKKDELKKRQQLNKIRREENAKKSEIVQVIKDPNKIKKMKRKQLRYIEKRDTTQLQS